MFESRENTTLTAPILFPSIGIRDVTNKAEMCGKSIKYVTNKAEMCGKSIKYVTNKGEMCGKSIKYVTNQTLSGRHWERTKKFEAQTVLLLDIIDTCALRQPNPN